ncbi:MAG: hypothetical protein EHM48_03555 [Planctomycetaceae bacterium]|nr:MAG: hypothetical protein EHM48_03555 [Planctomycetaceae bacterium]
MSVPKLSVAMVVLFVASICMAQGVGIPRTSRPPSNPRPAPSSPRSGNTGQPNQPATPKPVDDTFSGIYRFDSFAKGTLTVKSVPAGTTVTFTGVSDALAKSFSTAAIGDILNLQGKKTNNGVALATAAVYAPKPGEDDPRAYVFVSKGQATIGNESFTTVNVKKYFDTVVFAIPNTFGAGNKRVPDAAMLKMVNALVAGELVEIDGPSTGNPRVAHMMRSYGNVTVAKFSKAIRQTNSAATQPTAPSATGKVVGMTVINSDQPTSFNIDPASRFASILADKILRFKEGQVVIIRTTKDASDSWIIDVRSSPVQELPKPKTALPSNQPPSYSPPT